MYKDNSFPTNNHNYSHKMNSHHFNYDSSWNEVFALTLLALFWILFLNSVAPGMQEMRSLKLLMKLLFLEKKVAVCYA